MNIRMALATAAIAFLSGNGAAQTTPSARLLSFTGDLTESGTSLMPGFLHSSCWSGLGVGPNGRVYVAVSNHIQPGGGNVALYEFDPVADSFSPLGDVAGFAASAGNWMPGESAYKVHTFLTPDADGSLWFATMEHAPTTFLRGSHLFRLDTQSNTVVDHSQTTPLLVDENLQVVANSGQPTLGSGVFVETYGIKGLGTNSRVPDVLYAMTYPDGHLIRHEPSSGALDVVGQSTAVSYVFYVDNQGDCHYARPNGSELELVEYRHATGTTVVTTATFPGVEIGAIAPTVDGDVVYVLVADTKAIWRYDTRNNDFDQVATACGSNWWRLYNLTLSPNGRALYYVSNNNALSVVHRIDLITGACTSVVNVDGMVGTRDLCFGGVSSWDAAGRFYAPVWTWGGHGLADDDIALLQVQVDEQAFSSDVDTLSLLNGGAQTLRLELGPDLAGSPYWVVGTSAGSTPGLPIQGRVLPLNPSAYLTATLMTPNSGPLTNSFSTLDAEGGATSTLVVPPGSQAALAGIVLHHAAAVFSPSSWSIVWISAPVESALVP